MSGLAAYLSYAAQVDTPRGLSPGKEQHESLTMTLPSSQCMGNDAKTACVMKPTVKPILPRSEEMSELVCPALTHSSKRIFVSAMPILAKGDNNTKSMVMSEARTDLEFLGMSNYEEIGAPNEADLSVLLNELIETHGTPTHTDRINLGQDPRQDTLVFKDIECANASTEEQVCMDGNQIPF
jgi:hypothetical protein